ncbi:hypothetical protein QBC32DRAFT_349236 [Pseudoneurospora amorphoporcata]|uniref:Secreted protein n=1 Tax=Pseudoneurospora amorphoporcata TaxID=241081 RepID=A0AAN6NPH2_9PEZI|nr:hypothetical protein QBC32DRAFT_349236 [Pseudoneurospora amorphoporcata]
MPFPCQPTSRLLLFLLVCPCWLVGNESHSTPEEGQALLNRLGGKKNTCVYTLLCECTSLSVPSRPRLQRPRGSALSASPSILQKQPIRKCLPSNAQGVNSIRISYLISFSIFRCC